MKKNILGIFASGLLLGAMQATAAPVIIGDQEWLQPVDFVNLSWNDINAVCDASGGGVCTGSLNSIDVTGYTWASVAEINALFNWFIGSEQLGPGAGQYIEVDSAWAPAFFATGFQATYFDIGVRGLTRNLTFRGEGSVGSLFDNVSGINDTVTTFHTLAANTGNSRIGAWFYRDITQVPEPTSLALLGLSVVGVGFVRRWKSR